MSDLVRYEIRPPAAVITIARADKRNGAEPRADYRFGRRVSPCPPTTR